MSITSSMYTGVTGLLTYSSALSVIGNNLANVNTVGFKATRAQFSDLISAPEAGQQIGRGVRLAAVSPLFTQGVFQATGGVTDLAIQGKGFFIVKDPDGKVFYTRDGQFTLNKNGALVNPSGLVTQGFQLDRITGQPIGGLTDIIITNGLSLLPNDTDKITLAVNLDATTPAPAAAPAWPAGPAPATDWYSVSDFATTITVFDSLGQAHDLTYLFAKSGANTWEYRVVISDADINTAATAGNLTEVSAGTLVFNNDGSLDTAASTVNDVVVTGLVNGAADITVLAADMSFVGSTQYAAPSVLSSFQQNGSAAGILTGIAVNPQGIISGQYSNGGTLPIYQLALADFPGVEHLDSVGNNLFAQSANSGDAIIGPPGRGGFGTILPGGLELSTVDVAQEFVGLIGAQRGFQANSRMITVADQMYEEAVNLKR